MGLFQSSMMTATSTTWRYRVQRMSYRLWKQHIHTHTHTHSYTGSFLSHSSHSSWTLPFTSSSPFLFSIRAGEGTTPHVHCDTNCTPTQGHSVGVMGNAGGCQRQTKASAKTRCPAAAGNKTWYSRSQAEVLFSLAADASWGNWIHQTKHPGITQIPTSW